MNPGAMLLPRKEAPFDRGDCADVSGAMLSRDASAVVSFLAEAVGLLLRKPHEMWELQQDILEDSGSGKGAGLAQPDTSLLPVTVLRQAIRVAGSSKMPEACIVAICKYVEGGPSMYILHTTLISVIGAVHAD